MINSGTIRTLINSKDWLNAPFNVLSNVSTICTSNLEIGRDLVIRLLEDRNELSTERGYPLVSRNGMLAVCKKKFAIRYLASITRVH